MTQPYQDPSLIGTSCILFLCGFGRTPTRVLSVTVPVPHTRDLAWILSSDLGPLHAWFLFGSSVFAGLLGPDLLALQVFLWSSCPLQVLLSTSLSFIRLFVLCPKFACESLHLFLSHDRCSFSENISNRLHSCSLLSNVFWCLFCLPFWLKLTHLPYGPPVISFFFYFIFYINYTLLTLISAVATSLSKIFSVIWQSIA